MITSNTSFPELYRLIDLKDTVACKYIYDKYAPALYGIILRIIPDKGDASLVLRDTFLIIYREMGNYDPENIQLFTWMFRIANKVANQFNERPLAAIPAFSKAMPYQQMAI